MSHTQPHYVGCRESQSFFQQTVTESQNVTLAPKLKNIWTHRQKASTYLHISPHISTSHYTLIISHLPNLQMVSASRILANLVPDLESLQDLASCTNWGLVQTEVSRTHLDGQRLPKKLWDFRGSPNWMIHCVHLLFKNALFLLGSCTGLRESSSKGSKGVPQLCRSVQSCRDGTWWHLRWEVKALTTYLKMLFGKIVAATAMWDDNYGFIFDHLPHYGCVNVNWFNWFNSGQKCFGSAAQRKGARGAAFRPTSLSVSSHRIAWKDVQFTVIL